MKTQEELDALKEEFEALNKKLSELTDDELAQVTGGQAKKARAAVAEVAVAQVAAAK